MLQNLPEEIIEIISEYTTKHAYTSLREVNYYLMHVLDKIMWSRVQLHLIDITSYTPRIFLSYPCSTWSSSPLSQTRHVKIFCNDANMPQLTDHVRLSCFKYTKTLHVVKTENRYLETFFRVVGNGFNLESLRNLCVTVTGTNVEGMSDLLASTITAHENLRLNIQLDTISLHHREITLPIFDQFIIDRIRHVSLILMHPSLDYKYVLWIHALLNRSNSIETVRLTFGSLTTEETVKHLVNALHDKKFELQLSMFNLLGAAKFPLKCAHVFQSIEVLHLDLLQYDHESFLDQIDGSILLSVRDLKVTTKRGPTCIADVIYMCRQTLQTLRVLDYGISGHWKLLRTFDYVEQGYTLGEAQLLEKLSGGVSRIIDSMAEGRLNLPLLQIFYYTSSCKADYSYFEQAILDPFLSACPQLKKLYLPKVSENEMAIANRKRAGLRVWDSYLYNPGFFSLDIV